MNMEENLLISDVIKKNSRDRLSKFLDKMVGNTFYLYKQETFIPEPLTIKDVYGFVAEHYKHKLEDSYTGYFVEFPLSFEHPKGLQVTYFEIRACEINDPLYLSDKPMTRDEIFIETCPIFPTDYTELGFSDNNNLGVFFYKPVCFLD
jgi:hypothetical protein